ncbi:neural-cadherin [Clonorchis sinensis]|uniref:Neural-cadherin n=1 Tax=Clonorchis sinensis TaxID=79923 RepID=H2KPY2_CLOSI|nr:neural-cadherin [Clonorchis sinensis]
MPTVQVLVAVIHAWLHLPLVLGVMGSPPKNLPPCLNGGTQNISGERYGCTCVLPEMDRQCKLTRVTVGGAPTELLYGPLSVTLNRTHSFRIGLQYITNDPTGNGTLLSVRNASKQAQISFFLIAGRPGFSINLNRYALTMQFNGTVAVTNDNAWHHLDLILEADAQGKLAVYFLLDRCRNSAVALCQLHKTVDISPLSFELGPTVQLGAEPGATLKSFDGCLDKIMINEEVLDFYGVLWQQPSKRGCQKAEQGCKQGDKKVCGQYGICHNALSATDMLTCLCYPGYKPNASPPLNPDRWPCERASVPWSTTAAEYNARFVDIVPARVRLSIRTRKMTFTALVVASWNLHLTVNYGIPKLRFGAVTIELNKVNVSDGNWHLYEIGFLPSFIEIQIDGLDKDFYRASRVAHSPVKSGPADLIIAKDADGACLDDAWVDFDSNWRNIQHDYPLEVIANPWYTRHIDWPVQGRQQSCSAGTSLCNSDPKPPCDPSAVCVDEWRGYRCDCIAGMKMNPKGVCLPEQCVPNPCAHGACNATALDKNFTCTCDTGWTGDLCEQREGVAEAGFVWWWILLIVLLIILIIIIIIVLVCCCCRKRPGRKHRTAKSGGLDSDQLGMDSQFNDPWDAGEKDFTGSIDYSVFQPGFKLPNGHQRYTPDRMTNGSVTHGQSIPPTFSTTGMVPRDHGQKTSVIPPWVKFEGQENPAMNLDQALEYGYEGFDGKPPPEFWADDPARFESDQTSEEYSDEQPDSSNNQDPNVINLEKST